MKKIISTLIATITILMLPIQTFAAELYKNETPVSFKSIRWVDITIPGYANIMEDMAVKWNYIYFVNADDYGIYRANKSDGSNPTKISQEWVSTYSIVWVDEKYIYYYDINDNMYLYKMNLDWTWVTKLAEVNGSESNLLTDWDNIYFGLWPTYVMNREIPNSQVSFSPFLSDVAIWQDSTSIYQYASYETQVWETIYPIGIYKSDKSSRTGGWYELVLENPAIW
jgi:hypothetical protein